MKLLEKEESLPPGPASLQAKPYVTSSLPPAERAVHAESTTKKMLTTQRRYKWCMLSDRREGKNYKHLIHPDSSSLNYSDKDYATCPNNFHTLSATLLWWPPCFSNILIPGMLTVLVTGTGSNQRQMGVLGDTGERERERETAINKMSLYSSCIGGNQ